MEVSHGKLVPWRPLGVTRQGRYWLLAGGCKERSTQSRLLSAIGYSHKGIGEMADRYQPSVLWVGIAETDS